MIKKRFGSKQYKFRIHPNFLIQIVIIKKKKNAKRMLSHVAFRPLRAAFVEVLRRVSILDVKNHFQTSLRTERKRNRALSRSRK